MQGSIELALNQFFYLTKTGPGKEAASLHEDQESIRVKAGKNETSTNHHNEHIC